MHAALTFKKMRNLISNHVPRRRSGYRGGPKCRSQFRDQETVPKTGPPTQAPEPPGQQQPPACSAFFFSCQLPLPLLWAASPARASKQSSLSQTLALVFFQLNRFADNMFCRETIVRLDARAPARAHTCGKKYYPPFPEQWLQTCCFPTSLDWLLSLHANF